MRSGIRLRSAQRSPADRRVKAVGAGPANRPAGTGRCRRTRAASETGERAPSREFTVKVVEVADGATERLLLGVKGEAHRPAHQAISSLSVDQCAERSWR